MLEAGWGKGRSTVHVLPLSLHAGAHRACYLSRICGRPTPYRGSPAQRWHPRHCKSPGRWCVHAYPSPVVLSAPLPMHNSERDCFEVVPYGCPASGASISASRILTCCLLLFRTVSVSPSLIPTTVARNMADNMLCWQCRARDVFPGMLERV